MYIELTTDDKRGLGRTARLVIRKDGESDIVEMNDSRGVVDGDSEEADEVRKLIKAFAGKGAVDGDTADEALDILDSGVESDEKEWDWD